MILQITQFEYNVFFGLTILLLITKAALSIYLGKRLLDSKKETGKIKLNFITAFFVLILCLFISRLFYLYFDFFLTKLDPTTYYLMPNVWVWKIAGIALSIGFAFVLYTLDKKALKFKLKGIPAYCTLGSEILVLIIPVNSQEDFVFVSGVGIIGGLGAIMVLIIFLYIGIKIPGLRKPSFMITLGLVTYVLGALLFNEFIVSLLISIFGPQFRVTAYTLFMILKILGLIIIAFSVTKFSI